MNTAWCLRIFSFAATMAVAGSTSFADDSLRQRIAAAGENAVVDLPAGTFTVPLTIDRPLTLNGLDSRDSCPIVVRHNIFQGNTHGVIQFTQFGRSLIKLGPNGFWNNQTDLQDIDAPETTMFADPRLVQPNLVHPHVAHSHVAHSHVAHLPKADPHRVDSGQAIFSVGADEAVTARLGLANPKVLADLWTKWTKLAL